MSEEEKYTFRSVIVTMREEDFQWLMEEFEEKGWAMIVQKLREVYELWKVKQGMLLCI